MSQENNEIVPYEDDRYAKSNFLISSKFKSSLNENKILAISLSKIQKKDYIVDPETKDLVCQMKASELRKLLDVKGGSFYKSLEMTAASMTSRTIGFSDPESHHFEYVSAVNKATYENGVFTIYYSHHFVPYIAELSTNYTLLSLPTMLQFDSVWSFRLFELLKSQCYYPKGQERKDGVFRINMKLSELKLDLGAVNSELDSVRKILNNSTAPDYDKAIERSPEKTFNDWYEFRRKVLDTATKEINEKTEMEVSYTPQKSGRGGKVYGVDFVVSVNKYAKTADLPEEEAAEQKSKAETMTNTEKFKFHMQVMELLDKYELPIEDIEAISKAADYDFAKIQRQSSILKMQSGKIDNVTGWMIAAIKKDYKEPTSATGTSGSFGEFEQRTLDFDAIEEQLLNK